MSKCVDCGRYAKADSDFCFFCDPATPAEAKQAAWAKGGTNSRKLPLGFDVDDFLPIETPADLRRFYNKLLSVCGEQYRDDLSGFIRSVVKITPKLSEILAFEQLAAMEDRLTRIESRRNGRLLPSRINDNVDAE